MALPNPLRAVSALLGLSSLQAVVSARDLACKCNPNSPCWPSVHEWTALNSSLDGHLFAVSPPSSVCYAGPAFDAAACNTTITAFQTSDENFIQSSPVEVYFQNFLGEPCLPTSDPNAGTCPQGNYPSFVIDARSVEDMQRGVSFARERNIRLNIKNTGHSMQGTSLGKFGLSIRTHNFDDMEFVPDFRPAQCPPAGNAGAAVTFGAGVVGGDAQKFASQHGMSIPTGWFPSVGLAGWFQVGGHGPLIHAYGLGADNVLEIEVVTADGQVRTANQCQNPDLFYALRGGGGSTFGVVTKATMRVFPKPSVLNTAISINQTSPSDTKFWAAVAMYYRLYADASDAGIFSGNLVEATAPGGLLSFTVQAFVLEPTDAQFQKFLVPFVHSLRGKEFSCHISVSMTTPSPLDGVEGMYAVLPSLPGLTTVMIQSRLLGRQPLTEDPGLLAEKLNSSLRSGNISPNIGLLLGLPTPGPAARKGPAVPSAVNLAWYETDIHQTSILIGPPAGSTLRQYIDVQNAKGGPLIDLAPQTGNYQAEASIVQPDITQAFWGSNFARLAEIKRKWDPQGVFYCKTCVSATEWLETPE